MTHSSHNTPATNLADGLDQQLVVMETLRTCLEDEHRALQTRDPEELLSVTERKNACLIDAGRTNQLCLELETRDSARDAGGAVKQRREQLDTLTRVCHDLNTANGSLIRRQKIRVEKTLRIMHGEPERLDVYGSSGTTAKRSKSPRVLASI